MYNSVTGTTELSCIDHVYTYAKNKCSKPTVKPFGSSDHDLITYTRYSTNSPTIRVDFVSFNESSMGQMVLGRELFRSGDPEDCGISTICDVLSHGRPHGRPQASIKNYKKNYLCEEREGL